MAVGPAEPAARLGRPCPAAAGAGGPCVRERAGQSAEGGAAERGDCPDGLPAPARGPGGCRARGAEAAAGHCGVAPA
eukprot:10610265-Lingulodinium_polyedra.AAC.1